MDSEETAAASAEEKEGSKEETKGNETSAKQDNNTEKPTTKEVSQTPPGEKPVITWDQCFDNNKQDTPSERFWYLKGEDVAINGFLGEVLYYPYQAAGAS
jgi:hypothetical protein